jgi:hypothetical protein
LRRVVWQEFTDVSKMSVASTIALMIDAASASEKSVDFYQTTGQKTVTFRAIEIYRKCLNGQDTGM